MIRNWIGIRRRSSIKAAARVHFAGLITVDSSIRERQSAKAVNVQRVFQITCSTSQLASTGKRLDSRSIISCVYQVLAFPGT
jgi:hypothetical protein